jgi:hypothetical protein
MVEFLEVGFFDLLIIVNIGYKVDYGVSQLDLERSQQPVKHPFEKLLVALVGLWSEAIAT